MLYIKQIRTKLVDIFKAQMCKSGEGMWISPNSSVFG